MKTLPTQIGNLADSDWQLVHERVQAILGDLTDKVRPVLSKVEVKGNKTSTPAYPLYSYRAFSWPQERDLEAVIVGVMLETIGDQIKVRGDIGGEETGCTYFETEERKISDAFPVVLAAVTEIANQLAEQADVVVKALKERRMAPDYRKDK